MPTRNASRLIAIVVWSLLCTGQEVHVARGKGSVALSVAAQQPYQLLSGEGKIPVLSVECSHKGKKSGHLLKFLPGGSLVEDNSDINAKGGHVIFNVTMGGTTQATAWLDYGDTVSFVYFSKSDAERWKFIQSLLNSGVVSIEFKPFLTGTPATSTFDLSKLREEISQYPECVPK
jgi:hypothetical protein